MKKLRIFLIAIVMAIIVAVIFFFNYFLCTSNLVLENRSHEALQSVIINISNKEFDLNSFSIGESKSMKFKATSDSDYEIHVLFNSGKKLDAKIGYVTYGIKFEDTLIIGDNKIEMAK